MQSLRIDPKFRDKIPPLTDAEFEQLRENILADGEVYEPIAVWNGTIVDGHNRWRIIQEHPEIPYKVKEMEFTDEWAAFDWMYRKQLGRRNLTDAQRTYLLGKLYESRKKSSGGQAGNDNAVKRDAQNGQLVSATDKEKHGVSGEIAMELNLGRNTVSRAEHFAKGIDALREVSPEAADKIISGKANATKGAVAELKRKSKDEIKRFADGVMADEKLRETKAPRPVSKEMKDFNDKLNNVVEVMESEGRTYSLEDAVNDLNSAEDMFLMQIRFVIEERAEVFRTDDGRAEFEHFIKSVIDDLQNLKGEMK